MAWKASPDVSDDHQFHFFNNDKVGTQSEAREVVRTYIFSYLVFPAVILAPWLLAGALDVLKKLIGENDLVLVIQFVLIFLGIPWFAIGIWKLVTWDQRRRGPRDYALELLLKKLWPRRRDSR